jgi:hypothetical protein
MSGRDRRDDGATFSGATARGRGRPPVFLLVFLALLGGIFVAGFGGRVTDPHPSVAPPAALASVGPSPSAEPSAMEPVATSMPTARPVVTSGPGPLVLKARRNAATVYVHGDVFAPRVTWMYVALQDASGRVAGWTSVSVPDPGSLASPAPDGAAPMLFDVEVAVPADTYPGLILVFAHAHDADGALVGTAQLELAP